MNRFLEMEIFATVADAGSVSGAAVRAAMIGSPFESFKVFI